MKRVGLVVLMVLAGAGMATAQDATQSIPPPAQGPQAATPAAPDEAGRYSFHRIGDSFVRLDSRTGQVSQCGWASTGWSCKVAPDERLAFEGEVGRLQRENAELKKTLLSRGVELPSGIVAEAPPTAPPVPPANVPDTSARGPKGSSEAEIDRAMGFLKKVWNRLVDMMADLQRDIQKKT